MELTNISTPESVYDDKFCSLIHSKEWRYREVPYAASVIHSYFKPCSIIDIGCSNGIYLNEFRKLGCRELFGIEGTEYWKPYIDKLYGGSYLIHDLRKPLKPMGNFDLAISIEVLEHLEEPFVDIAVSNISSLSSTLLITACPTGGRLHPNPQAKKYWVKKFVDHEFILCQGETEQLQNTFRQLQGRIANMPWFKRDLMVFRRSR